MKLRDFLLHQTQVHELCVITENGWIVATAWIDDEDLFKIHPEVANLKVTRNYWGKLSITLENGTKTTIPCHYIDCEYVEEEE